VQDLGFGIILENLAELLGAEKVPQCGPSSLYTL
jgi:hypothetical protein